MPLDNFADEPFQEGLAAFLEQASVESLYSLQAHTRKANVSVTEARDTTDPALITQMLIPLLEAIGTPFQAPVLRKRIRDDVNIRDAELPWRRLPFWLVLRVAAQRQLSHSLGNEQGRIGYKLLMCILLAELLKESAGKLDPELTITLRAKLCRRMAKLKIDRTKAESTNVKVYEYLFGRIDPVIKAVIEEATAQVEAAWRSFKQATTRRIPKLPLRASNHALQLSLVNSGGYLDDLLTSQFSRQAIPHHSTFLTHLIKLLNRHRTSQTTFFVSQTWKCAWTRTSNLSQILRRGMKIAPSNSPDRFTKSSLK